MWPLVAGGTTAVAAAVAAVLAWPVLRPLPSVSFEEFEGHLEASEVDWVEAEGRGLKVGLDAGERAGGFRVPMTGRQLQELMARLESDSVPIRGSSEGSVLVEAVERGSGATIRTPVLTLASDELEGCAPCPTDEEVSLTSGWYEVRPGDEGWVLDSLTVRIVDGYGPEKLAVRQGSRIFLPGRADITLRAVVSLSPAGRRARAENRR
jgi:hypothetical protein